MACQNAGHIVYKNNTQNVKYKSKQDTKWQSYDDVIDYGIIDSYLGS